MRGMFKPSHSPCAASMLSRLACGKMGRCSLSLRRTFRRGPTFRLPLSWFTGAPQIGALVNQGGYMIVITCIRTVVVSLTCAITLALAVNVFAQDTQRFDIRIDAKPVE